MIHVYSKGVTRIKHAKTGEIYDISVDELDWDAIGSDERQMGPETHYQAALEHPQLGLITWNIWNIRSVLKTCKKPMWASIF